MPSDCSLSLLVYADEIWNRLIVFPLRNDYDNLRVRVSCFFFYSCIVFCISFFFLCDVRMETKQTVTESETGNWKVETGNRKPESGKWKLESYPDSFLLSEMVHFHWLIENWVNFQLQ